MKVLCLVALINCLGFAQSTGVEGSVVNSAEETIPQVSMWFYSLDDEAFGKNMITEVKGHYELKGDVPTGLRAYMSKDGYHPVIYSFGDKAKHTIQMLTEEDAEAQGLVEKHRTALATGIYSVARALFNQEDYQQAVEMAKRSLEVEELTATVKMAAFCDYKLGHWESAKSYAEKYLITTPDDASMLGIINEADKKLSGIDPVKVYNQAIAAINADDDETALGLLLKVIQHDDEFALAYFDLGQISMRAGDFDEGVDYLKKFIKSASKRKHKDEIAEAKDLLSAFEE